MITSPDSPELDDLCAQLRERAADLDRAPRWPHGQLRLCGEYGVYEWFVGREWGGQAWNDEQIGLLGHPPPALVDLERDLAACYGWLRELNEDEVRWAAADHASKGEVIAAIRALDGGALAGAHLY